ncbi:hypothetical protein TWF694_003669 [Orbilia ellipsospora]|uniref:Developmental regulatory protein wetA n=1 Tax=Orbilia ellipsospora TaxID=2528407 RepID=A0AAV9X1D3_9PEZI
MWKPDESKDAYASENGVPTESWWSRTPASGEHIDSLLTEYLHSPEGESEAKAIAEDQNRSFRARFDHPHSIGSHIPPQVPGIEITTSEGHPTSPWPRQEGYETSGPSDNLDGSSDALKIFRHDDIAKEVGDDICVSQTQLDGGQTSMEGDNGSCRHYNPDTKRDAELEGNLSPLESPADFNKPDQLRTSTSPLLGSLVKPEPPNKQASPSPSPVDITSPLNPHSHLQPHNPHPYSKGQKLSLIQGSAISKNKQGYLANSITRRSLSAVQQYRLLDERQVKRAPLWRRRVNYNSSLSDNEEMLATARSQAHDIPSSISMTESLRYQAQPEPSYFLHSREQATADHGDLFPLSPPLSSARSSFLCPVVNNNVAPHLNGNYNLSTESLPSSVEANAINLLSRPQSMPQLQEQMENPYSNTPGRPYLHQSPSHEYLSPENSFDDSGMMKPQATLSAYSSFNPPCSLAESLELENGEESSPSAQGSSPQTWWAQGGNFELAQDRSTMIYPTTTAPNTSASAYASLPNMSPKRRFEQTPSTENLHNQLLMLQHQQQPRSPMFEQDRTYGFMNGQQTHSAMPSPPGSPGYFFAPQLASDAFCPPTSTNGVSFIDPFHNSGHHQPQPQNQQYNTFPRRTLPKSLLGYDAPLQSTPPIPIRTVPSHGNHSNGITRSSYLRKTGSLGRSARMPNMGKNDPKEVSFVNFTPHDATKILSGVAPSGSSKTKARREREAQEKRRKLSEAAAAAVLAAGGDPSTIENIEF